MNGSSSYDSAPDTWAHIGQVRQRLDAFAAELTRRGIVHDGSKLQPPEKEAFDRATPLLRGTVYGSEQYRAGLALLGDALAHHYANNSHHPEFYPDGVNGMDLFDLIEMYADWLAAGQRHAQGDFVESLEVNRVRFGMSDQLAAIFRNTFERGWR